MSEVALLIRDPAGEVTRFAPGGVFRIGRHAGNNLVVDHPTVSKFHVRLTWARDQETPQVHDEGSHNGTFLDGQRLEEAVSLPNAGKVDLRVGDVVLKAEIVGTERSRRDGSSGFSLFSDDGPEISGKLQGDQAFPELLRGLELNKRTGTLKLDMPNAGSASLTFYLGKIMGAVTGDAHGLPAFKRILEDGSGSFSFVRKFEPQSEPLGYWPSDLMRRVR